jgi:hypothetical protein
MTTTDVFLFLLLTARWKKSVGTAFVGVVMVVKVLIQLCLKQQSGGWNYLARCRSSVYFRGIQFNQAAPSIMEQEMTCDMRHESDVALVLLQFHMFCCRQM